MIHLKEKSIESKSKNTLRNISRGHIKIQISVKKKKRTPPKNRRRKNEDRFAINTDKTFKKEMDRMKEES